MDRSSNGCWTCRIRHRKCDEGLPVCRECSDRTIPCHGYGQKPEWAGDEDLLRAELARIKRIVNGNFRRTRKQQQAELSRRRRHPGPASADARGSDDARSNGGSPTATVPRPEPTFREAQLLVHYLDYIFPLQYPYYRDEPALGGRGWLFWLLMKRGPLHQAVLTLSALHRHSYFEQTSANRESELIGYHTNALQRLRQVISESEVDRFHEDHEQLVEVLACGAALISFELFQGGATNWQPHLAALVSVVNRMSPEAMANGAADMDRNGIEPALRFLVAKVIWLDVLASTATDTAPGTRYRQWLELKDIDMSRVMGCSSWVMLAIGDLSTLAHRQTEPGFELNNTTFHEMEMRLESGMSGLSAPHPEPMSHAITKVFAAAALVQLHTTVGGRHDKDAIGRSVSRTVDALRNLPPEASIRGLAWPISVAGAVAAPDQQPFFEGLLTNMLQKDGSGFTNCGTVLRVLRHCWQRQRQRSDEPMWTWRDGMADMGMCALLV